MPKAMVDPDELRRFISQLEATAAQLREQKINTDARFAQLSETWRDEKYVRFEQVYTESMQALNQYLNRIETYIQFLKQKAARAQRYLDQR